MLIFFWLNEGGEPPPPTATAGAHGGMIVNMGRMLTRLLLIGVMTGIA